MKIIYRLFMLNLVLLFCACGDNSSDRNVDLPQPAMEIPVTQSIDTNTNMVVQKVVQQAKPKIKTTLISKKTKPIIQPNITNANGDKAKNISIKTTMESVTGPVNPPHGQPGHRCDIAVGAPLPKQ